ncbi:MAG: TolC family protein, partial [Sphingobacteriaceae bacterium]|nr:TolC family protein [Sphingobacteriaceae bacterium]
KNNQIQKNIAQLNYKIAISNSINPRIPSSLQAINNTQLQANFLPGEAFGLPKGSFKEITIGQKYNTTLNIQPQFDLINIANIAQIKSAKINTDLTENQNKISERAIYEKINLIYFNILNLNAQKEILIENISLATKIVALTNDKYKEGISRKQDLNEANVNLISLQDKLEQVELNLNIQYGNLDLILENESKTLLIENIWNYETLSEVAQSDKMLETENSILQLKLAEQEYKTLKFQNIPTLSFISSFNWQNLNQEQYLFSNSNWNSFNFVGLRLNWDLPTTVQKVSALKNKALQIQILKNNLKHNELEVKNTKKQLFLEYQKVVKQSANFKLIYELKKDNYLKNYNQYQEGIIALDKIILSQNETLNSKLNLAASLANVGYNKYKMSINNIY